MIKITCYMYKNFTLIMKEKKTMKEIQASIQLMDSYIKIII